MGTQEATIRPNMNHRVRVHNVHSSLPGKESGRFSFSLMRELGSEAAVLMESHKPREGGMLNTQHALRRENELLLRPCSGDFHSTPLGIQRYVVEGETRRARGIHTQLTRAPFYLHFPYTISRSGQKLSLRYKPSLLATAWLEVLLSLHFHFHQGETLDFQVKY